MRRIAEVNNRIAPEGRHIQGQRIHNLINYKSGESQEIKVVLRSNPGLHSLVHDFDSCSRRGPIMCKGDSHRQEETGNRTYETWSRRDDDVGTIRVVLFEEDIDDVWKDVVVSGGSVQTSGDIRKGPDHVSFVRDVLFHF